MIARCVAEDREWTLVYGGRAEASMAFTGVLATHGDLVRFWPQDRHGLIDLPALLDRPRDGTAVYSCGPEPLLAAAEQSCASLPSGSLHLERFRPREGAFNGPTEAFEVELDQSG